MEELLLSKVGSIFPDELALGLLLGESAFLWTACEAAQFWQLRQPQWF